MPGYMMKDKKKKIMYKDGKTVPELTSAQMKLPATLKDQIIRSKKKDMDKKKG
tara:strand:- start:852 stop:1010 length:159 start_codon:yes stop_codon:yes gene_type:complete